MVNNTQFSGWTPVLNSVKTPLGFFTLLALILDAILVGTAARIEEVTIWAPIGLLGLLLVGVFVIVLYKPLALYHPSDWPKTPLTVNLVFPIEPIEVDLNIEQCVLEVRDKEGRRKHSRTPNLTLGYGGWSFQLEDIEPSDSIRLELIEHNGQEWRVNPFAPYETEAKVLELN